MENCNKLLVSIVMPSYNAGQFIEKSIQSVLSQTYDNFELIIIDDCSKDNTVDIIKKFSDKRIKLHINEINSGAAISRNKGIREAKGKYIAFLDAEDIWLKDKLEKQISFMEENNYFFSYTDYQICHNGVWENVIRTAPSILNYRKIVNYCYCFTSTVIYNREAVGLIQIEDLKKNNDYAMWLLIIKKVKGYRLKECLAYYIKHDGSISSGSKFKLIKYHYIMFRKQLKKNAFLSILLTCNNLWHGFFKKIFFKKKIVK